MGENLDSWRQSIVAINLRLYHEKKEKIPGMMILFLLDLFLLIVIIITTSYNYYISLKQGNLYFVLFAKKIKR